MTRVKRGVVVKKTQKVIEANKRFWGQRKKYFKRAKETLLRANGFFAFREEN